MNIADIHAHILPAVDDGASDIEESLSLLRKMASQGITDVVATPHFNPSYHNLEDYKAERQKAYNSLIAAKGDEALPNIYLGSEVYYYKGISKSSMIRELCFNGSDYLLLELNYDKIQPSTADDIIHLAKVRKIVPILAHIERYLGMKGIKSVLSLIDGKNVLAHVNCGAIVYPKTRKKALGLIKNGYASFITTDTHNLTARPPLMEKALKIIENELGLATAERLVKNAQTLLEEIKK